MRRSKITGGVTFLLGMLLAAGLLQCLSLLKGDSAVFPRVGEIGGAFVRLLMTARTWELIGATLLRLVLSLLIAGALGLTLGVLAGLFPLIRGLLRPLMILLRAIPMIVIAVIVMVLAPYAHVPVICGSLLLLPLITEAASEGIRRVEPELIDVYRMNSQVSPRIVSQVYLPLIGGYLAQAFQNAVGMGVKVIVTTEFLVQAKDSLGKAVFTSQYFGDYADIYAYALIMALLALLVGGLPGLIRRILRR